MRSFGKVEWDPARLEVELRDSFFQLLDWVWRLSAEGGVSTALERVFGALHPHFHLVMIIGRSADLNSGDRARLQWCSKNVAFGAFRMSCFTFDGALSAIRRRIDRFHAVVSTGN